MALLLSKTLLAFWIVRRVRGAACPMAPRILTLPVPAAISKVKAPSKDCDNVISAPPVFKEELAVKFNGAAKLIGSLAVTMASPSRAIPVPLWVKDPSIDKLDPFAMVKIPELAMFNGPLFVVVTLPRLNAEPVSEIPEAPEVVTVPLNEAMPVSDVLVRDAAVIAPAVTLLPLLNVTAPSGVVEPAAPLREILPPPAWNVKDRAPSTVLFKVMLEDPALVSKVVGMTRLMGPAKEMGPWIAWIVPAKFTGPGPIWR